MEKITIEQDPQGGYLVNQGDLESGCVTPDEALGIVAHALYANRPHKYLKAAPKPAPVAPPVDTLVEVYSDIRDGWVKRYSAGRFKANGDLLCWTCGATSKTADGKGDVAAYEKWRIVEDSH